MFDELLANEFLRHIEIGRVMHELAWFIDERLLVSPLHLVRVRVEDVEFERIIGTEYRLAHITCILGTVQLVVLLEEQNLDLRFRILEGD